MRFQILISTMNNSFHDRGISIEPHYLVINQITNNNSPIKNDKTLNLFNSGLSVSRNYALEKSKADICMISDDDLTYLPNIEKNIVQVFNTYPDVDIITFKISNADGSDFKNNYAKKPFYHNMRSLMRVSSVEIVLRRHLIEQGLRFDEDFGLGSDRPTGEEIIFLTDALKKGNKILYYPLSIVCHPTETSGSNYQVKNLAKAKGAMFYRVFSWKSYFLCLLFSLKHYKKTPYSFLIFYKELLTGIQTYKKRRNE